MKRLAFLLAAAAFASPVRAQGEHQGQDAPTEAPADDPHAQHRAAEADSHAAHRTREADPHAGHRTPSPAPTGDSHADHQPVPDDPHAGHRAEKTEPHAGHRMPQPDAQPDHPAPQTGEPDSHAGHDVTDAAVGPPMAPPGAAAFSGPEHAADAYYGEGAMARARAEMSRMHGAVPAYRILVERLEAKLREGRDAYSLDAQAWYGGDLDKLWLKADADGDFAGQLEGAELQALWSHAIGPFFDLQAGVRLDIGPGPERTHLVLGVQGLAPYWIEVDAAAFLSDKGDVTARIEAEHDARITQRLILQPRIEAQFALQDIPSKQIGSGLSEFGVGARLRYHATQLIAPYVGIEYERAMGDTRRLRRLAEEHTGGIGFVAGVRFWF
jgi:copper resistance protein B